MKLVALCAAAGAGKDTAADMLPARKLAFADTLYREVAGAFGVTVEWLQRREYKETPSSMLSLRECWPKCSDFLWKLGIDGVKAEDPGGDLPRSPRQILQWWGDYRRDQDPDYFVHGMRAVLRFCSPDTVITDVRFPNEAAMVRQLGGQIWQIRRPGYEAGGTGHASDTAGDEFAPDRVVVNGGSLEDLRATVLAAWEGV